MWPAATDRRGLASTLGQRAVEIDTHDRFVAENYADRACYGPMNKTFGALDAEKQSLHPGLAGSDGEPQLSGRPHAGAAERVPRSRDRAEVMTSSRNQSAGQPYISRTSANH
jgi:hypothetical protein